MDAQMKALVDGVREHARKHYNEDGWDFIIETYEDDELAEAIGDAKTLEHAIDGMHRIVKMLNERRLDQQLERF